MIYTNPTPESWNDQIDDAGTIHEWLESQGFALEYVSIVLNEDEATREIEVSSDQDPSQLLQSYETPVQPETLMLTNHQSTSTETSEIQELRKEVASLRKLVGTIKDASSSQ